MKLLHLVLLIILFEMCTAASQGSKKRKPDNPRKPQGNVEEVLPGHQTEDNPRKLQGNVAKVLPGHQTEEVPATRNLEEAKPLKKRRIRDRSGSFTSAQNESGNSRADSMQDIVDHPPEKRPENPDIPQNPVEDINKEDYTEDHMLDINVTPEDNSNNEDHLDNARALLNEYQEHLLPMILEQYAKMRPTYDDANEKDKKQLLELFCANFLSVNQDHGDDPQLNIPQISWLLPKYSAATLSKLNYDHLLKRSFREHLNGILQESFSPIVTLQKALESPTYNPNFVVWASKIVQDSPVSRKTTVMLAEALQNIYEKHRDIKIRNEIILVLYNCKFDLYLSRDLSDKVEALVLNVYPTETDFSVVLRTMVVLRKTYEMTRILSHLQGYLDTLSASLIAITKQRTLSLSERMDLGSLVYGDLIGLLFRCLEDHSHSKDIFLHFYRTMEDLTKYLTIYNT